MATNVKTTIAGQLNAARLAISNTLADDELLDLVAAYGYTKSKLEAGKRLYEAAVTAVNAQAAAAPEEDGRPLRRQPRPVGSDEQVGRKLVAMALANLAQIGRVGLVVVARGRAADDAEDQILTAIRALRAQREARGDLEHRL